MLEFKNVSYGWDERHFLQNNLNLKFEERKIYVILYNLLAEMQCCLFFFRNYHLCYQSLLF